PRPTHDVAALLAVVLALASGAASHAPVAGPAAPVGDCGSALMGLTSYLPCSSPVSTQGNPPKECCTGVKTALASPASVACLYDAFGKDYGIPMNLNRAKGLPAACGGNPAALNNCSLKLPGGAPNSAPTEDPCRKKTLIRSNQ
ncbi:non-specific lipid transfer protein-like 1, partial [Triticum dicoccoides]|uniref:non-specific lipid transfer protein-like 1 n=1 Tax=Triticum dicoccoides TaxID=85692 RepID=UPI00189184E7